MDAKTDPPAPRLQRMEHWLIRCDSCGTIGHTHTLSDLGSYGRALGRTCFGELAEFSAWEDPVSEEAITTCKVVRDRRRPKNSRVF